MAWFPARSSLVAAFWLAFGLWWTTRALAHGAGGALVDGALALAGFAAASYVLVAPDTIDEREAVGARDALLAALVVLSFGLVASAVLFA